MRALTHKVVRDLSTIKGQAIAIALVIASGLATFIMSMSTLHSLEFTRAAYYERTRFAQVFAHLKRAPNALADRISAIPGVALTQQRIVIDVNLSVPGMHEPATGRLISLPPHGRPILNRLYLRHGKRPGTDSGNTVLVSEAFAEAHALSPNDRVTAVINGKKQELIISGIVLSPEYILQIKGGDLMPDERRFGVFWMQYQELAAAFDMEGAFNDVTLTLSPSASQESVIAELDGLLKSYGGLGAYGREDQLSHRYLSDEIKQLRNMSMLIPTIFLGVAAFLFNVVLSRIVNTQREQIAALKAFGYSRSEIGRHYLMLVLSIAFIGTILGIAAGAWLGSNLTELYTEFYRFPILYYELPFRIIALAFLISSCTAGLGAFSAVHRATALPPAEAMRPEPPPNYKPTVVEKIGLQEFFTQSTRIILRNLERRPGKALLSCTGIAMAIAILVLGNFASDSIQHVMDFTFETAQRQDMMLTFVEPPAADAINSIDQLPGVQFTEPFRAVSTKIHADNRSRRVGIMGLPSQRRLYRVYDEQWRPRDIPEHGLLVSKKLAEVLRVRPGDTVTIEVLERKRPVRQAIISGLVSDYTGISAYMEIDTLNQLLRDGDLVSGAYVKADGNKLNSLYDELKETPRIADMSIRKATLESFRKTMAENILRMQSFNVMFACIIAFGVAYNNARVSFSERSRELATLRVIGLTKNEISTIMLGEIAVLTLAAVPIGITLGYGLSALVASSLDTELYRIPLYINSSTYGFAVTVVAIATIISGMVVRRKIDHLDLIGVLKSRE